MKLHRDRLEASVYAVYLPFFVFTESHNFAHTPFEDHTCTNVAGDQLASLA